MYPKVAIVEKFDYNYYEGPGVKMLKKKLYVISDRGIYVGEMTEKKIIISLGRHR